MSDQLRDIQRPCSGHFFLFGALGLWGCSALGRWCLWVHGCGRGRHHGCCLQTGWSLEEGSGTDEPTGLACRSLGQGGRVSNVPTARSLLVQVGSCTGQMGQVAIISFQSSTPKVLECFNVESRILSMVYVPEPEATAACPATVPTICLGTEEGR